MVVFQVCCEFYEFNLVHFLLETEETKIKSQRKRIQPPKYPFCNHNVHLLRDIRALCTIWLIYTQLEVVYCKDLDNFPDQLVW